MLTPEEKLEQLYEVRDRLHPLAQLFVIGFVETKHGELEEHDRALIETIYPLCIAEVSDAGLKIASPDDTV